MDKTVDSAENLALIAPLSAKNHLDEKVEKAKVNENKTDRHEEASEVHSAKTSVTNPMDEDSKKAPSSYYVTEEPEKTGDHRENASKTKKSTTKSNIAPLEKVKHDSLATTVVITKTTNSITDVPRNGDSEKVYKAELSELATDKPKKESKNRYSKRTEEGKRLAD